MASTVTLQFGGLIEIIPLFDGRVHMPTIKDTFQLRVAKINGVLAPADSQGFTHAKFKPGDTLDISGTPADLSAMPAVRTLDDVTLISEATARAIHRLKREEESEQEETISCTASSTPFVKAEAAARQLGFQVKTVDCELATNAREQPLEPDYIWEHDEDSVHEKEKVLARLTHELDLSSKTLQATAVFAKPLGVVQRGRVRLSARTDVVIHPATATFRAGRSQLNRYLQLWELKTSKALQTKRSTAEGQALVQFLAVNILTDRAGWGVPVVLSDLAEATVFQRGNEPKDIFHVQFQSLREAYAHIRWLLDSSKADNPGLRLDTSRAPPAAGMFTIMEHEANLDAGSTSSGARLQTNEYDATDDNTASFVQKERLFKKQLYWLAAKDERVSAFLSTLNQNPQRMPSILDFVPSAQCG